MENPSPVERAANIMQCRMPWSQAKAVAEDLDRAGLIVGGREVARYNDLRDSYEAVTLVCDLSHVEFLRWLVALDEPGNQDRRSVTLSQIIDRARKALGV